MSGFWWPLIVLLLILVWIGGIALIVYGMSLVSFRTQVRQEPLWKDREIGAQKDAATPERIAL
jgi:hypothetical protein